MILDTAETCLFNQTEHIDGMISSKELNFTPFYLSTHVNLTFRCYKRTFSSFLLHLKAVSRLFILRKGKGFTSEEGLKERQ